MEGTGMLAKFVGWVKKFVKTPGSVVALTEGTCIFSNVAMPDQYVSIVVGGRMYGEDYEKMELYPAALSNALESSATITSALVPWNTCGAYMTKTLGLPIWGAGGYGPWAIFNWLMPIMNVILAYMGISVADKDGVRLRKKKRLAKKAQTNQKL
jgi:NhaC family Na+:H+ antiporter